MCQILQVIVYEKCVFAMVYKGNIGGSSDILIFRYWWEEEMFSLVLFQFRPI